MKSYREMANMMETKMSNAMQELESCPFYFCSIADSWLAYIERDNETSEEDKRKIYEKILDFIEKNLEGIEPNTESADRALNLTFTYIAIRQKLERPQAKETKAQLIHVAP